MGSIFAKPAELLDRRRFSPQQQDDAEWPVITSSQQRGRYADCQKRPCRPLFAFTGARKLVTVDAMTRRRARRATGIAMR